MIALAAGNISQTNKDSLMEPFKPFGECVKSSFKHNIVHVFLHVYLTDRWRLQAGIQQLDRFCRLCHPTPPFSSQMLLNSGEEGGCLCHTIPPGNQEGVPKPALPHVPQYMLICIICIMLHTKQQHPVIKPTSGSKKYK